MHNCFVLEAFCKLPNYFTKLERRDKDLGSEIMVCCQRMGTKGLKDQAGNRKCNPTYSLKRPISPIERESHCGLVVPARTQPTDSLLKQLWQGRDGGFIHSVGKEL